jgi:hypothetical protein
MSSFSFRSRKSWKDYYGYVAIAVAAPFVGLFVVGEISLATQPLLAPLPPQRAVVARVAPTPKHALSELEQAVKAAACERLPEATINAIASSFQQGFLAKGIKVELRDLRTVLVSRYGDCTEEASATLIGAHDLNFVLTQIPPHEVDLYELEANADGSRVFGFVID